MTGDTIAGDTRVVKSRGCEHINRVAKLTILVCRQVVGCLNQIRISRKDLTVMTTLTTLNNARMNRSEKRC